MNSRTENRHVAVIGGSNGIGLATTRLLAGLGARVTIGGRDRGRLDAAVKEVGHPARGVVVDAEDVGSLRGFYAEAGPISDLVVTVTRRGGAGPAADLAQADLAGAFGGGVIETGWWDEVPEDAKREAFAAFAQRALVRRNGQPEDVAKAIVALVDNDFITGVVLPCDGGLRLT
jgi:NAD(P)-dependent dehydrogenase (short-subunit alcohol dehydrogenase family)